MVTPDKRQSERTMAWRGAMALLRMQTLHWLGSEPMAPSTKRHTSSCETMDKSFWDRNPSGTSCSSSNGATLGTTTVVSPSPEVRLMVRVPCVGSAHERADYRPAPNRSKPGKRQSKRNQTRQMHQAAKSHPLPPLRTQATWRALGAAHGSVRQQSRGWARNVSC